jgi:hypothetical protein
MLVVALGKDDVKGEQRRRAQDRGKALAGKSTFNRLELTAPDYEGSPRRKDSDKPETKKIMAGPESIDALLVDLFLEAQQQAPDRIILDLDATDDRLYGQQEGFLSRLLPGLLLSDAVRILRRAPVVRPLAHLRYRRPGGCRRRVAACGSADSPALAGSEDSATRRFRFLSRGADGMVRTREHGLALWLGAEFPFEKGDRGGHGARPKAYEETQAPARVFREFFYATQDTWSRERRVIAKAEHLSKGANPRFVVTSLSAAQMEAQELYEKGYCARGECPENRIKEQQFDLFADRTSTGKMWSNQLRLYFLRSLMS